MQNHVVVAALALTAFAGLLSTACGGAPPLPAYGAVPAATLIGTTGESRSLQSLQGHVVIYDFIFTRCAATCPMMAARMGELTRALKSDEIRFVSISVDPEWDTPEVLEQYRRNVTKDQRWIFLTGTREGVRELSVEGFMLAAEPPAESIDSGPIVHSSKFILVDRSGEIRGFYDSLSHEAMEQLAQDARRLLDE